MKEQTVSKFKFTMQWSILSSLEAYKKKRLKTTLAEYAESKMQKTFLCSATFPSLQRTYAGICNL